MNRSSIVLFLLVLGAAPVGAKQVAAAPAAAAPVAAAPVASAPAAAASAAAAPVASANSQDSLKVGDAAPDFSLPFATQDSIADNDLTLSSVVGKRNLVLAFYPADWSGGCTKEVCSLRDNFSSLSALDADVIGLSGDYVPSHYEWAKFHHLPFRLASDHKHAVAKRYSSYNDESGFDRRTVYVVDKAGKIAYIDLHYSPRDSVSFGKLETALRTLH